MSAIPKTYLNASGLSRRLGIAPKTLRLRMADGTIAPDAAMHVAPHRAESPLFDLARVPELRRALRQTETIL
ncbi:MAG: hypothetical protein ACK45B_05220 [Limisphaerales bacterium]